MESILLDSAISLLLKMNRVPAAERKNDSRSCNSNVLQLASSHGPTAQLKVTSVQMQVRFVREQPLAARAGPIHGGWKD